MTKTDRAEAVTRLQDWLKDGDTLWFILRHRATSGMQRVYDVKQIEMRPSTDTETYSQLRPSVSTLSWNIAMACNFGWNEARGGIKINGCGFSGEQEIADAVGRKLGLKLRYETL